MIPLTELRIGNIIRHNVKDDAGGFCEPNEDVISEEDFNMFILDKTQLEAAERVPLTEEWLIKFGFEVYEFDHKDNQYRFKDRLIVIRDGYFQDYGSSVTIKYLHQLQNLYFALTNSELEIKNK